jgi:hypothetical protein
MRKLTFLAAAVALLAAAGRARAIEYEVPIDIDTEEDLYELLNTEQLSQDSFDALLDLFQRGVSLEDADSEEIYALPGLTRKDADAIVAYRRAAGSIGEPEALVAAGVIPAEKLRRIIPFLQGKPNGPSILSAAGRLGAEIIWTSEDGRWPATLVDARVQTLRDLTVGIALTVDRNGPGDLRWDPNRDALSGEAPAARPQLAKLYADWRTPSVELVAGSFKAGFAQQLTFDDTALTTPNGIYPDEVMYRRTLLVGGCGDVAGELPASPCPVPSAYVTPDFQIRVGLFGLGAMARQIVTDAGWLQLTAFASRQVHSIYQYQIYDRDRCADPTHDKDPACAAPDVYHRQPDPLTPTSRYAYQTLSNMWAEPLAGGNATFFFNRRTHIGVTGYGAKPDWLVRGANLDFQEWARWPYGGAYGAVGADAAWGEDVYDLGVEVTRAAGGEPGAGGLGAVARGTVTWPKNELELSLRYYEQSFANPYAGAIAEPDVADGQRARDEAGARVRFGGRVDDHVELRGLADFWVQPSTSAPKIRVEARGDYFFDPVTEVGLYTRWQDKDLRSGGFGSCYFATTEDDPEGQPIPCTGQKLDFGALVRFEPLGKLILTAEYQHRLVDDPKYPSSFMQEAWAWLMASWVPTKDVRLYARSRLLVTDLANAMNGERSVWTYLEASYRLPKDFLVQLRYDNRYFFDDRASTMTRVPNPEHWLRLLVESKF